jgi:hypothetical protein
MEILITGGYGALGYHLLKCLRAQDLHNENRICCIDIYDSFAFEYDVEKLTYNSTAHAFNHNEMYNAVTRADIIVHLAEYNNPLTDPLDAITNNVGFTTQLLMLAAHRGKRVIVPCWKEFYFNTPVTPWESSIKWRQELSSMFNMANAVVNQVFLPRLISPLHTDMTYGNLVKRFYTAGATNQPADVSPGEIDDKAEWCWVGAAVEAINSTMARRTRASVYVNGAVIPTQSIAEYISFKLGGEVIEVREPKDKILRATHAERTMLDDATIQASINRCIEVWNV